MKMSYKIHLSKPLSDLELLCQDTVFSILFLQTLALLEGQCLTSLSLILLAASNAWLRAVFQAYYFKSYFTFLHKENCTSVGILGPPYKVSV